MAGEGSAGRWSASSRPGRGTSAALPPALAVVGVCAWWLTGHPSVTGVSLPQVLCLVLAPATVGRVEFVVSGRVVWRPVYALLLVVAACAGPIVAVVAAVVAFATRVPGVWRARLAWGATNALAAFAAGAVIERAGGSATARAAEGIGLGVLVLFACFALIAWVRRIDHRSELVGLFGTVVGEGVLLLPALASALVVFPRQPWLVVASLASAVGALILVDRVRAQWQTTLGEARRLARRDQLTEAPNRIALEELLAAEYARVLRGSQPVGVLFVDADRFRDINNGHGYATGDRLLVAFYERLRTSVRTYDVVCRWGGEEFVIVLPGVGNVKSLQRVAEQVRRSVGATPFAIGELALTITASVGGALLDDRTEPAGAVRLAGDCVRRAKATRNASVVAATRDDEPVLMGGAGLEPATPSL